MKIYVYPSDEHGCGMFRMIWPAEYAQRYGTGDDEVVIVPPGAERGITARYNPRTDVIEEVSCPADADVIVMQRVTHHILARSIRMYRQRGVAVVVELDDDLASISPNNTAYAAYHPDSTSPDGSIAYHNWNNLKIACRDATLVTVTTEALAERYAGHGRFRVLRNYLPDSYYGLDRTDSTLIGWPAGIHSHPEDPEATGGAIQRVLSLHADVVTGFTTLDDGTLTEALRRGFRLREAPIPLASVTPAEWPELVASLGIGIAPLADTKFNAAKSWLKPLELAACGVPWLASPRTEYRRIYRELNTGHPFSQLAGKPHDWYRKLRDLAQSADLRAELSEVNRVAAERFRIRDHAGEWLDAWRYAGELEARARGRAAVAG